MAVVGARRFGRLRYSQRPSGRVPGYTASGGMRCSTAPAAMTRAPSTRLGGPAPLRTGTPARSRASFNTSRGLLVAGMGQRVPAPVSAATAWWHPKPPEGSGLRQSPYRFLTLCGPADGVDATLRDLAGICTLDGASPEAVQRLLGTLAQDYAASSLAVEPLSSGNARQAFVGLHRLAYERLSDLVADGMDASDVLPPSGRPL